MAIKFYGKSQDVGEMLLETFKSGNLPSALAPVFIHRSDNVPSQAWSWLNRFIMAIHGADDARGFRQWQEAGRKVKKGGKAFHILGPIIKKRREQDEETGDEVEKQILVGFKSIPVFGLDQTEVVDPAKWEKQGGVDTEEEQRLKNMPLYEVARAWGLTVTSYNGRNSGAKGYYNPAAGTVALGVQNLATWTHELIHAADDKNGTITKKPGQQPDNEIVAELGGAILLTLIGEHVEADLGGAWEYIKHYAGGDNDKAIRRAMQLIDRTCSAVDLVIKDAEAVKDAQHAA